jgi:hypothetical protein
MFSKRVCNPNVRYFANVHQFPSTNREPEKPYLPVQTFVAAFVSFVVCTKHPSSVGSNGVTSMLLLTKKSIPCQDMAQAQTHSCDRPTNANIHSVFFYEEGCIEFLSF